VNIIKHPRSQGNGHCLDFTNAKQITHQTDRKLNTNKQQTKNHQHTPPNNTQPTPSHQLLHPEFELPTPKLQVQQYPSFANLNVPRGAYQIDSFFLVGMTEVKKISIIISNGT